MPLHRDLGRRRRGRRRGRVVPGMPRLHRDDAPGDQESGEESRDDQLLHVSSEWCRLLYDGARIPPPRTVGPGGGPRRRPVSVRTRLNPKTAQNLPRIGVGQTWYMSLKWGRSNAIDLRPPHARHWRSSLSYGLPSARWHSDCVFTSNFSSPHAHLRRLTTLYSRATSLKWRITGRSRVCT